MSKQVISQDVMDVIAVKSAELTIAGFGVQKQADILSKEMNLTLNYKHIERYRKRDAYKNFMLEVTEEIRKNAKAELVRYSKEWVPLIHETILSNLKDGNINAIAPAMKVMGFGEEEKAQGGSSLTVIMPGASKPDEKQAIEVDDGSDKRTPGREN